MAKNPFEQMTQKQKLTAVAFVVVIAIILWQIKGLLGSSSPDVKPAPQIQTAGKMSAAAPGASMQGQAPSPQAGPAGSAPQAPASAPLDENLRQATVVGDSQFMKLQKMTEEKYIEKLNELEELKIQRQIAETNQAITAAKLATVTAEKDISDLLTAPTAAAPAQVPASAYANQLTSGTEVSAEGATTPPPPLGEGQTMLPPPPKVDTPADYSLISVSMQMGKWSAVLGLQGKLYGVNVGDVLPPDGSVVTNVNKNSIILRKDGKTKKISIISSI